MDFEIGTVTFADFRMKYVRFGKGERPLVILPGIAIQSVTLSAAAVAREYSRFSEDFTVYLFDRRDALPDSYSVYDMARDTACALDSLKLGAVYLYGVSQGGMMALSIAIDRPGTVKKLALCSTDTSVTDNTAVLDKWISLAKQRDAEGLYKDFAEKIYPERIFKRFLPMIGSIASSVTEEELSRFVILAEGTRGFDVSDKLGLIRCPVFVAGARDDAVLGDGAIDNVVKGMSAIPGYESYVCEGYGHAAYDLAPDLKDKLYDFFMR